jgi:hypothetical protein
MHVACCADAVERKRQEKYRRPWERKLSEPPEAQLTVDQAANARCAGGIASYLTCVDEWKQIHGVVGHAYWRGIFCRKRKPKDIRMLSVKLIMMVTKSGPRWNVMASAKTFGSDKAERFMAPGAARTRLRPYLCYPILRH